MLQALSIPAERHAPVTLRLPRRRKPTAPPTGSAVLLRSTSDERTVTLALTEPMLECCSPLRFPSSRGRTDCVELQPLWATPVRLSRACRVRATAHTILSVFASACAASPPTPRSARHRRQLRSSTGRSHRAGGASNPAGIAAAAHLRITRRRTCHPCCCRPVRYAPVIRANTLTHQAMRMRWRLRRTSPMTRCARDRRCVSHGRGCASCHGAAVGGIQDLRDLLATAPFEWDTWVGGQTPEDDAPTYDEDVPDWSLPQLYY